MAKEITFQELERNIRARNFSPVYLLQGKESYYIDRITDLLVEYTLDESERDFGQTIVYGMETDVATIINICKQYPMMSERKLVIVKEAKGLRNIDELVHYVKNPLHSTILAICHKHDKLDGRKKLTGEIAKTGVVFESKELRDYQIPAFITSYLQSKGLGIDDKATQLLADYLGTDLSKLSNEMDKLVIAIPEGLKRVTCELIEQNIGISKDYNIYELQKAVAQKDILKANRIAKYFEQNPKANPLILTLNNLFTFFSNLMICQYESDKSKGNLMAVLNVRWDVQVADYLSALKCYSPGKTMNNIALIREFDARSKGFNNHSVTDGKLLIELLYKLMH